MDIGLMMKMGGLWMKFSKQHPKFPEFIKSVQKNGLPVDTVLDIKISYPDGKTCESNLKVTADDIKMLEELKKLKK